MVFFLYGQDSFRRHRRLQELIAPYKAKYSALDIQSFDLEDEPEGWATARDFLNQPSMFVESKVAIVKEGTAVDVKEWVKALKEQVETPKNFVFISQSNLPSQKFEFLLEKPVRSQEFKELEGGELEQFVRSELKSGNLKFDPAALGFFCSYVNSSEEKSALAVSEIEKIGLMNLKEPVTLNDLRAVIAWRSQERAYVLAQEILRAKDKKAGLKSLEKLLLEEDAAYAFNSLGFQARGEAAEALAGYDISVKSGGLEYEEALLDFILR